MMISAEHFEGPGCRFLSYAVVASRDAGKTTYKNRKKRKQARNRKREKERKKIGRKIERARKRKK